MERFLLDPQRFAPGTTMWQLDLHDEEAEQISKLLGGHVPVVTIEDLAVGPDALLDDGGQRNMGINWGGLVPELKYSSVQIRVVDAVTGNVTMSEPVMATADGDGIIQVRWRTLETGGCLGQTWDFRAEKKPGDPEGHHWRRFVPSVN